MFDHLQQFIADYGYLAIAVGCFFEGETALLLGALAAQQQIMWFPEVVAAAFVGTLIGDNFWFYMGRHLGQPFIARHPRWRLRARYAKHHLDRYGSGFIIGLRFFYGLRSVTPFVMGAAYVSRLKFFVCDLIGSVIWLTVVASVVYALGSAVAHLLELLNSGRGALALTALGLILFAAAAALVLWRARVERTVRREES